MRLAVVADDWQRDAAGVVQSEDNHRRIVTAVPPPENTSMRGGDGRGD